MSKSLPDLYRAFSRAIQQGRGLRLEAADLDLLCAAGVIEVFSRAAAEEQRRIATERVRSRRQEGEQ